MLWVSTVSPFISSAGTSSLTDLPGKYPPLAIYFALRARYFLNKDVLLSGSVTPSKEAFKTCWIKLLFTSMFNLPSNTSSNVGS